MESNKVKAVLALDVGSSSVRAAFYDEHGEEIAGTEARIERGFITSVDGGAELDAEQSVEEIFRVIDEALAQSTRLNLSIESISTSCFWHSLVAVDRNANALTPLYGWADTRSSPSSEALRSMLDESRAHARTGCRFHPSYWPAKILWLREKDPNLFQKAARWLSFSDLLYERLCVEAKTSVSMASGTGLLNIRECAWDEELLYALGITQKNLPKIAEDGEFFRLNKFWARRWPRLAHAHVLPAVGDGAANNVGAGCMTRERVALMVGTSGAMRVVVESEVPEKLPHELWCYRLDDKRIVVGGALTDGGRLYEWMRGSLNLYEEELEEELQRIEPDSHGLTVLPFWSGERSTGWNSRARGAILGLSARTRPVEILRASLEAVAYRFAHIARSLDSFAPGARIVASGGALNRSRVWAQIIADVLGRTLYMSSVREASSRGTALLALEAEGKLKSITEAQAPVARTFEPSLARHERYKEAMERHQKIYERIVADEEFAKLVSDGRRD